MNLWRSVSFLLAPVLLMGLGCTPKTPGGTAGQPATVQPTAAANLATAVLGTWSTQASVYKDTNWSFEPSGRLVITDRTGGPTQTFEWSINGKHLYIKAPNTTDDWETWLSSDQKVMTLTAPDDEGKPMTLTFNRM